MLFNNQKNFFQGLDQCDGSNETDGLQTHQLSQGEDDDNTPHWSPIPRGLPSTVLPVSISTHTHTHMYTLRSHVDCIWMVYCFCSCQNRHINLLTSLYPSLINRSIYNHLITFILCSNFCFLLLTGRGIVSWGVWSLHTWALYWVMWLLHSSHWFLCSLKKPLRLFTSWYSTTGNTNFNFEKLPNGCIRMLIFYISLIVDKYHVQSQNNNKLILLRFRWDLWTLRKI